MRVLGLIVIVALISGCQSKVDEGIEAYKKKDYRAARIAFEGSHGNGAVLYYLGDMYLNGRGVPKDVEKGLTLYKEAESHDYAMAYFQHGRLLVDGNIVAKDAKTGLALLEQAAAKGVNDAYFDIGMYYTSKDGGRRGDLAEEAFKKSNSIFGQHRLALLYEKGTPNFPDNPALARITLESALEHPDREHQTYLADVAATLAEYYFWGFGGPADESKAIALLEKYPGDKSDEFRAWLMFSKASRQPGDAEAAVKIWTDLAQRAKEEKFLDPTYTYIGLAAAYYAGMGAPASDIQGAVYREQIIPIGVGPYLLPAMWAQGVFGPPVCAMPVRSGNPGRYRALLLAAYQIKVECFRKGREYSVAHSTAFDAELAGFGVARAWQREIERYMSPAELERTRKYEQFFAAREKN
ncbi:tetratricopeptide repeat protein [Cupriavidus sp. 8B]